MSAVQFLSVVSVLFSGLYGFFYTHRPLGLDRSIVKTIPVAALAGISAVLGGPVALTVALALGAVGDWFLSRPGTRAFLSGLVAFLFGHIGFIVVMVQTSDGALRLVADPWRLVAAAGLLVVAGVILSRLFGHLGKMKGPVLAYFAVIVVMGLAALNLPLTWPLGVAIAGAVMFIASDAILGFELFIYLPAGVQSWIRATVLWFLYWGGQAGICFAILNL